MKYIALLLIMAMSSGCTMMAVRDYNAGVDRKLIEMRILNGRTPAIGFNTSGLTTGYFAAWKDNWIKMLAAHGGDAVIIGGTVYAAKEIDDANDSSESRGTINVTVNGDVNEVMTINIVNGEDSDSNNDNNGTGSSNNDVDGE